MDQIINVVVTVLCTSNFKYYLHHFYVLLKSWPKDQKVKNLMLESLKQKALKRKEAQAKIKYYL